MEPSITKCPHCGRELTRGEVIRGVCRGCKELLPTPVSKKPPTAPELSQTAVLAEDKSYLTVPLPRKSYRLYKAGKALIYVLAVTVFVVYSVFALSMIFAPPSQGLFGPIIDKSKAFISVLIWACASLVMLLFVVGLSSFWKLYALRKLVLIGIVIEAVLTSIVFIKLFTTISQPMFP